MHKKLFILRSIPYEVINTQSLGNQFRILIQDVNYKEEQFIMFWIINRNFYHTIYTKGD